ncbi:MAG: 3'-5' exonuclease, partial [bacterium]
VKSYGEKVIADFLFEHGLTYKYEKSHPWGNFKYKPDFTVYSSDQTGVIIEYFGLSGDPDYDEMSDQKRKLWSTRHEKWDLLEYFPKDVASVEITKFYENLKADLETCGIICKKLSEDEIWERLKKRSIDRYTAALKSFILKCRKYWLEPDELIKTIKEYTPLTEPERMFNSLAVHFYRCYLERIEATGEDDFDGLMQKATLAIESGNTKFDKKAGSGDLRELRYIFIDEFQDFSEHFWRLTDAIRKQNPAVKFFCVGDDWQAINGFAGSDLKFFSSFSNHFDNPSQKYIATNYRSAQKIVNIGNALMDGLGKPARSNKEALGEVVCADLSTFINTTLQERQRHNTDKITPAVTRLVADALNVGSSVVLLSRTNRLPYYLSDANQEKATDNQHEDLLHSVRSYFPEALQKRITISTAHKYKGLEKQTVIILDAVMRCYPLIHPDWVFSRILGDDPQKIVEEERRLFYVALTRAVDKLIVITEGDKISPFLEVLQKRGQLQSILWDNFPPPPALGESGVVVVKITSQPSRGSNPSYSIKDLLKASGYTWESTGRKPWVKGFPSISFDIEHVKHELWATNADGIEVGIFDEQQIELKRYYVDGGEWREM